MTEIIFLIRSTMYRNAQNIFETRRKEHQLLRTRRREQMLNSHRAETLVKSSFNEYFELLNYILKNDEFKTFIPNIKPEKLTDDRDEQLEHFIELLDEDDEFDCWISDDVPSLSDDFMKICPNTNLTNGEILNSLSNNSSMECEYNLEAFGFDFLSMNVMATILTFMSALIEYIEQNIKFYGICYMNYIEIVINLIDVLNNRRVEED